MTTTTPTNLEAAEARSRSVQRLVRRHVEVVTLSFDVRLEYQSDAGREYLVASLKRDARVDMGGGGDVGMYGMKSVDGTARVTPNDKLSHTAPTTT